MKKLNFEDCFSKTKINKNYDYIFDYKTNWKFYKLNLNKKDSLWYKLQEKIDSICDDSEITTEDIEKFLDENPDIEFEFEFFNEMMPHIFFFKTEGRIYCYSCDIVESENKNLTHTMARFYFDIEKFY